MATTGLTRGMGSFFKECEHPESRWLKGQRHQGPASLRMLESTLKHHLLPTFGSRRMGTFDHKVVEAFIETMERNGVGLAAQTHAFVRLKTILLDAHRLGLYEDNPVDGVQPPQYDPKRAVIPSLAQLQGIRTAGDDAFNLVAELMSGCGLRNGEALAVNVDNIVADDVYRITEQVNQTTKTYARLKHRKAGEYRDVPLPARTKQAIEHYADTYGTVEGYLLRNPKDITLPMPHHTIDNHRGIPITDVAEWMGHRSIEITFKTYRHLMPGSIGKAAKIFDLGLAA
ncbi:tyrosine-type recombinase/integrase [Kitasatospora phosalacinea]|uniref:tyrosine-type recombinase/integrase n=1 Tax=Kitasatospora phosalacinea TaxID=2065 RepID=UPI001FD810BB|nr:site-specific integrase [Kitasatospora phosalacinea]